VVRERPKCQLGVCFAAFALPRLVSRPVAFPSAAALLTPSPLSSKPPPPASNSLFNIHNDARMMTDNPLASSYVVNTALEDFFNFDMLSGPSGGPSGSSSRSSSNSPAASFSALPPTPPNPFETIVDTSGGLFDLYLNDDVLPKSIDSHLLPPTSAAPFDFIGAFPPVGLSSPEGAFSSSSPSSGDSPVTIDPTLVDTPSSLAKTHSEFGDEEDNEDDEGNDDLDDTFITPIKVGGKGKDRKGTVQSGGIVKKTSDKKNATGMMSTTSVDPDDWRPTPEEYKKMSSKEKRQLRNKISARNFRVRRKGIFFSFISLCPLSSFPILLQNTLRRWRAISRNAIALLMRFAAN
jgi:bZIP-type transcription factor MBZ1